MGRTTRGVRAITLNKGDEVVSAVIAENDKKILAVTENGFGKCTELGEYRLQSRAGKGIYTYKLNDKTGKLAGLVSADEESDLMLITSEGIVIRMHINEISTFGRQTQGVRVMRPADGVKVASIAVTERYEENEVVGEEQS